MPEPAPRTITLTRRGTLAVGLVTLLMLVLLGGQLAFIAMQRGIVDDQRKIAERQEARSARVLETTRSLLGPPDEAGRHSRGSRASTASPAAARRPSFRSRG